jgi:hypothetical protein
MFFLFRLVAEQQDWKELQVDVAFQIGRDLQNVKLMEMARGMLNVGNLHLLPEFRSNNDERNGTELIRKMGSTPSYDQIVNKYRVERDVTRHAGAGKRLTINDIIEIDGEEINVEDIQIDHERSDMDTSVELQEIVNEFDEDCSLDPPAEVVSVPHNENRLAQTTVIDFHHQEVSIEHTEDMHFPVLPLEQTDLIDVPVHIQEVALEQMDLIDTPVHEVPPQHTDVMEVSLEQTNPEEQVPIGVSATDESTSVAIEQMDLMDAPVPEFPSAHTDLIEVPVQEIPLEQTYPDEQEPLGVLSTDESTNVAPVNKPKPTLSLVPDYDLTPSPVSSTLDRGSSSLMLM